MNIEITQGISGGSIAAIPAKADAHRAFIAAALSGKRVAIRLGTAELSQDIAATLRCLEQLGTRIVHRGNGVRESVPAPLPVRPELDCGESGSTLRFLLPVAAALGVPARFSGSGRLPERPLTELMETMTNGKFRHLPVVEDGRVVGLISIGDVVKWRVGEYEREQEALRDYIKTA